MNNPASGEFLRQGKAKDVRRTDDPERLILTFRDDISAFDGEKTETLSDKGKINNAFNTFIMQKLEAEGIPTHLIRQIDAVNAEVKHLRMLPVEFVARNIAAGSLCKRLGVEQKKALNPPLIEFFYKDDDLHDPLIAPNHAVAFGWASREQLDQGETLTLKINDVLVKLFADVGIKLVDFKLEFGADADGVLTLGDEFTPDSCRLWDAETDESLDKDRFRKDLGEVTETYAIVAKKLGIDIK